ncbi:MAG: acetyl-CoA carboxylase carboxyltransferase subunit beta [Lachnoclostridium sp.]|nr:acetyl-CoA carboxylase carboxyltransferase subunit beta [Lachnoclostridium sp.]
MFKNMFKKTYTKIDTKYYASEKSAEQDGQPEKAIKEGTAEEQSSPQIPVDLWRKCNKCGKPIYVEDVYSNHNICPKCGGYFRISAYRRIKLLADQGSFEEWDKEMEISNPIQFPGYEKKILAAREKTNLNEAIVTGRVRIGGYPTAMCVCDARFLMSSMGHNVGEKITRAVERATEEKLPVIIFACSGGARMQEGMVSLMQMAKTSAALKRHHEAGQLFISVLTDPTTGGVTASFAMLGDIILAEPGALIGFAGPRVIEQTIGQKLPEGFQKAEFLMEHGFIDKIVKREEMKETLTQILKLHGGGVEGVEEILEGGKEYQEKDCVVAVEGVRAVKSQAKGMIRSAWDSVQLSRKSDRLVASDYVHALFDDFMEFHGDRYFKDDGAIIGGIASFHGMPVTVIGQEKGKTTKENIFRNFGMPSPEGYRKALRLMKQAESFGRPIICLIDTPGAFCGIEAEERGQGEAIARNLFEMSALKVPVLSIVIGEGGSGGALAMAVANEVWMLENAIYSILSPEGFASILWKDSKKADVAAKVMKITAGELKELGIIERVIPEEEPASLETLPQICAILDQSIEEFFETWSSCNEDEIVNSRYDRFRQY